MNYKCGKRKRGIDDEDEKHIKLRCDEIKIVNEFCCTEDMLRQYDSTSEAVMRRIRGEWKKLKELS